MMVSCRECGKRFEAQATWQKLCRTCYRERERERTGRLVAKAYEEGRRCGYEEGYRTASRRSRLSPALLRELVTLCHPDRHPPERFELANRITAELVSMRGRR